MSVPHGKGAFRTKSGFRPSPTMLREADDKPRPVQPRPVA